MAADKANGDHVEHVEHEAPLAGAIALASLFSNCVVAFGLIHPGSKWEKAEQLLLTRLGVQQARLLIWGDIVGITSPPTTVTDRAVPKHPSAAYPDLNEPTFFGARDARLEDADVRTQVEDALGGIVDRGAVSSREEMMAKYGLKPPKRFSADYTAPLDTFRLDHFRERYELLQEVAEDYAQLNTRRSNSIVQTTWVIADHTRFASFIKLTQEKVDFLVNLMGVKGGVDRAMRMDIRAIGWHLSADRLRIAQDVSKLRLVQEACKDEYPEYVVATQEALGNIEREKRENSSIVSAAPMVPENPFTTLPNSPQAKEPNAKNDKHKRPGGLFGLFKNFGKSHNNVPKGRSQSVSAASSIPEDPPRSQSDAGPITRREEEDDDVDELKTVRSKSVGDILPSMDEEFLKNRLELLNTQATVKEDPAQLDDLANMISRHDQYHGIARTATKDLRQT